MLRSIHGSTKNTLFTNGLFENSNDLQWVIERVVLQMNDDATHLKNNNRLKENVRNSYSWLTCGSWLASPASHYTEWQGQQQSLASGGEFPTWSWFPWPCKDRCQRTRMTHEHTNLKQWLLSVSEKEKWEEPHLLLSFLLQQKELQGRK